MNQQSRLSQRKGIGHGLILRIVAGKFRGVYGQQHIPI